MFQSRVFGVSNFSTRRRAYGCMYFRTFVPMRKRAGDPGRMDFRSPCLKGDMGYRNDDGHVKIITRGRFVASPPDMVPESRRIGGRLHWVHRGCAVCQKARIVCLRNQVHRHETARLKQKSPNIFVSRRLHYAPHLPDLRMGFDRSASIRSKRCFATAPQANFVLA